ncbi:hypothetical protein PCANC_20747 [Puccinia coronata f. sp. avenae]|uniref:Uncharacterized protein n=1 Tax=Puccinia coronata f. sp. avenae TaxID=200324 RepID=A0A2N5U6Q5_9BASI|nr:hypothetical protein PCANC_20747 [Puccinia coronata f. sp. avenae]
MGTLRWRVVGATVVSSVTPTEWLCRKFDQALVLHNKEMAKISELVRLWNPHPEQSSNYTINFFWAQSLPENLARMAASKFISDAAIQFKLGRAPLSESLTDSNSVAKRLGR